MQKTFSTEEEGKYWRRSTRRPEIGKNQRGDLTGLVILITREREKARLMGEMVAARGGSPLIFSTIETRFALHPGQVENFKNSLHYSSWVVLTSAGSAEFLMKALGESFLPALSGKKIGAVGKKTAAFLEEKGLPVHIIPGEGDSSSLGRALMSELRRGDVVFFPRAREGRKELIKILKESGFPYHSPVLYETVVPGYGAGEIRVVLETPVDYATFASPSSFNHFVSIAGKESSDSFFKNVKIAVIGNTTAACVEESGYPVAVKPDYPHIEGLLDAISACESKTVAKEEE